MENIIYISNDILVYPDRLEHNKPYPPYQNRLNHVINLCRIKLIGQPYVKDDKWIHDIEVHDE